jgi:hypothetical protein
MKWLSKASLILGYYKAKKIIRGILMFSRRLLSSGKIPEDYGYRFSRKFGNDLSYYTASCTRRQQSSRYFVLLPLNLNTSAKCSVYSNNCHRRKVRCNLHIMKKARAAFALDNQKSPMLVVFVERN